MGFFDSVQEKFNQGTAAAGRSSRAHKLKGQLNAVNKRRQAAAAQLGASLFEETRNNPAFRSGREQIYSEIEALDTERDNIMAELASIEAESQNAEYAAGTYICQVCGATVKNTDFFCASCGTPAESARPQVETSATQPAADPNAPRCPHCQSVINPGDSFCMACGKPIVVEETVESVSVPESPAASGPLQTAFADTVVVENNEPKPAPMVCPQCSQPYKETDLFCFSCGYKLK